MTEISYLSVLFLHSWAVKDKHLSKKLSSELSYLWNWLLVTTSSPVLPYLSLSRTQDDAIVPSKALHQEAILTELQTQTQSQCAVRRPAVSSLGLWGSFNPWQTAHWNDKLIYATLLHSHSHHGMKRNNGNYMKVHSSSGEQRTRQIR